MVWLYWEYVTLDNLELSPSSARIGLEQGDERVRPSLPTFGSSENDRGDKSE